MQPADPPTPASPAVSPRGEEQMQNQGWTENDQERPQAAQDASVRLLHYSTKPIEAIRSRAQDEKPAGHRKPVGLWVSVEGEDDWRSWCEAESFGNPSAQLCYVVTLAADANVLRIRREGELLAFNDEYGCDPYAGRGYSFTGSAIQWERVAEKYDGIIIAPYIWSMRLDDRAEWYYGWDCASGCIWNARAIASLALITPERPEGVDLVVDRSRSIPNDSVLTPPIPHAPRLSRRKER